MTYGELLDALRRGQRLPQATIDAALAAAGKTADDALRDVFTLAGPARPGDPCPCGGRLKVVNTRILADRRVRYVGCPACGRRPPNNKLVGPTPGSGR